MSKIVIAISGIVTAFLLALTAAAVYAYRSPRGNQVTVQQQQPASQPPDQVGASLQLAAPAPVAAAPSVAPQDAASIASKAINRTDLYSIELADYQGTQAYKVTFSSGDIVYVGLDGQVLGSEVPPAPILITQSGSGGSGGGGQHSGSSGSGGHEDDHHEYEGGGGDD